MSTRSFPDRVRHAISFEAFALAIFTPAAAFLFDQPLASMGAIGLISATIATLWNFLFNLGFDHAMIKYTGETFKTIRVRIAHTLIFEAGLILVLIPFIAWYLGISLWAAVKMDLAIVAFYLVYAFCFNIAYDRTFPIARPKRELALAGEG